MLTTGLILMPEWRYRMHLTERKNADSWLTFSPAFRHPAFCHLLMIFQHHIPSIKPAAAVHGPCSVYPFPPPAVWSCIVYLSTFFKCRKDDFRLVRYRYVDAGTSPKQEFSGNGLECQIPECRCRRHWPQCRCQLCIICITLRIYRIMYIENGNRENMQNVKLRKSCWHSEHTCLCT